jgi:hypothetical protein
MPLEKQNKDQIIFLGNDIVDKIYYCPKNRSITVDNAETQKLGLLLIGIYNFEV